MTTVRTGDDAFRDHEAARSRALVDRDFDQLDSMIDDDLVYTHSAGFRDSKSSLLGHLRSGVLVYHLVEHELGRVEQDGDLAWASGSMHSILTGGDREFDLQTLTTLVWRRRDGVWRLLSLQATSEQERPS